MKKMYIDCSMGAAGDMLTAALLELFEDKDDILRQLNEMGVPDVEFRQEKSVKCGITGTHMRVLVHGEEEESLDVHEHDHEHEHEHEHEHHHDHDHDHDHEHDHHHDHDHEHEHEHDHEHEHHHDHEHDHHHGHVHHHTSMHDIGHIVKDHLNVPDKVKDDILAVYGLIAEAESAAHGVDVDRIHFHEVGNKDAIADMAAVSFLMNLLKPDEVIASPVHVGSGQVKCAHGILPVPAPATAHILNGVPIYGGNIRGELCTPTGAALLKHFATGFGSMPLMSVNKTGYGMGKKDFEAANCVRIMLGETEGAADEIYELSCNVDDMTGEAIGFAMERLFEAGAREVFTIAAGMKKNRPGTLINVICDAGHKEELVRAMFRHTTTIGIRQARLDRYVLERRTETVETGYGPIRRKISSGYGVERTKYEYDDLAEIARKNKVSISELNLE